MPCSPHELIWLHHSRMDGNTCLRSSFSLLSYTNCRRIYMMKLHAAFLAILLAAGTTVAMAQTSGQSTVPSSGDDQMTQQPVAGQNNQTNPNADPNMSAQPQS